MINRNLKDGSQAGWNAGGVGWNQIDECRHPDMYLNMREDISKDDIFTLALPYYPSPGSETVINEPGHYQGYFCNKSPHSDKYAFKPAVDWRINTWSYATFGGHGCCYNCYVVLVELQYMGIEIEEPTTDSDITGLILIGAIALALWLLPG